MPQPCPHHALSYPCPGSVTRTIDINTCTHTPFLNNLPWARGKMKTIVRSSVAPRVCMAFFVFLVKLATARQLSPGVSTTLFDENGQQSPLVTLRAGNSGGAEPLPPLEREIFAEDPSWASKVAEFMVRTGANTDAVERSLKNVRETSWAAGRTFRRKQLVLLAFAEDVQPDGEECASCRLTRAVLAASKHTTGAHFVLVANGFTLDAMNRDDVGGVLVESGWKSFTVVEVPEFEGFSAAVNRAMKTIPDNSIVAILSTSDLLAPSSTGYTSPLASSSSGARNVADGASIDVSGGQTASDVFVGYERMQCAAFVRTSPTASKTTRRSSAPRGEAIGTLHRSQEDRQEEGIGWGRQYDQCGHVHHLSNTDQPYTLLVTASPSRSTTNSTRVHEVSSSPLEHVGDDGPPSVDGRGRHYRNGHHETEPPGRPRSTPDRPPPTPAPRKAPNVGLSTTVPFPLLVFDTQTFISLGKLDERFAYQGGIADWISRAKLVRGNQGIEVDVAGCCGDASPYRHRRSPKRKPVASDRGPMTCSRCSEGAVPHVHEHGWGNRFLRPWAERDFGPRRPQSKDHIPCGRSPSFNRPNDGMRNSEIWEQTLGLRDADVNGFDQQRDFEDARKSEDIIIDQSTRLSLAELEVLAQADVDLFFLPLLLSPSIDVETDDTCTGAPHEELCPIELCVAFHSKWMKRAPDRRMLEQAVIRRNTFPVAVVVVAHDEVSLLRPALEEVAVVVEHILVVVSLTPWHGDAKGVSSTLGLLADMLADVDSPTHGKLRIEVGSWATEPDQREYGNAVIRDDPREFFRVVAMDTGEFWHPVELARALVLAAENPEARHFRAQVDTYWANVRSVAFPPEIMNAVWLADPRRCVWREFREIFCDVKVDEHDALIDRSVGIIRHLSYHEQRNDLEQLQLRPVAGNLAIVDVSEDGGLAAPLWATGKSGTSLFGSTLRGADAVWSKLLQATSSRDQCLNPPCGNPGKHIHAPWADLAEEMSRIEGAIIVRRPDLGEVHGMFAPHVDTDYVKTLQSYFEIFRRYLFPGSGMMTAGPHLAEVRKARRFIDAVQGEDSAAARYLSPYTDLKGPKTARSGYEKTPTLVSMADVFINNLGYVWNKKDYIVPTSCEAELFGPRVRTSLPTEAESYEKVFVMAQRWGDEYFHFFIEALPRITLMLDILKEHLDIKIALYAPQSTSKDYKTYMVQFLELLGLREDRVIFIQQPIHADLAILSSSAPCFEPDARTINMLRHTLLQALYPSTGGVPIPPSRPVVVLVVRKSLRWLKNNDQVREALQEEFPSYQVVEFFGAGPIVSQLKLFATASLVVAPHGAGLSNILVSHRHTPVLEIAPPACTACYVHLALKLQHIYARHPGSSTWTALCESEYEPNVEEIIILVRHLLEGKQLADAAGAPNSRVHYV